LLGKGQSIYGQSDDEKRNMALLVSKM